MSRAPTLLAMVAAMGALAGGAVAQTNLDADHAVNLVCYGEGEKPDTKVTGGYEWDHHADKYRYQTRTELTTKHFDTALTIQIADGGARIQLPKRLIPPLNNNGGSDWWNIRDLSVSDDQITGWFKLNGMNQPKVRIDRRSGRISVKGMSEFHGTCDPVDAGAKRF
ncbi:MAG: hypothetical protein U1C74_30430 [Phenylobacterium sp.]|nr:hypothetical protein [Phenylobacterium sp.]